MSQLRVALEPGLFVELLPLCVNLLVPQTSTRCERNKTVTRVVRRVVSIAKLETGEAMMPPLYDFAQRIDHMMLLEEQRPVAICVALFLMRLSDTGWRTTRDRIGVWLVLLARLADVLLHDACDVQAASDKPRNFRIMAFLFDGDEDVACFDGAMLSLLFTLPSSMPYPRTKSEESFCKGWDKLLRVREAELQNAAM